MSEAQPADLVGHEVAGFRISAPLGQGGFARAYAAAGPDGQAAVVKIGLERGGSPASERFRGNCPDVAIVLASLGRNAAQTVSAADVRAVFAAEAQVLQANHGGVLARLLAQGDVGSQPALVLERIAGPDLRQRLAEGHAPSPEQWLQLLQALEAIGHHGDLKPAHVFFTPDGVRLIDPAGAAQETFYAVTPEYNPLLRRGTLADLYAVAAMIAEALTGRLLFFLPDAPPPPDFALYLMQPEEELAQARSYRSLIPRLAAAAPAAQRPLAEFVDALLDRVLGPRDGWPTLGQAADLFRACLAGSAPASPQVAPAPVSPEGASAEKRARWLDQALTLTSEQSNAAGLRLVGHYLGKAGVSVEPIGILAEREHQGDELAASLRTARACVGAYVQIAGLRPDPWRQASGRGQGEARASLEAASEAMRGALAGAQGVLEDGCHDAEIREAAARGLESRLDDDEVVDSALLADPSALGGLAQVLASLASALRRDAFDEAKGHLRGAFELLSTACGPEPTAADAPARAASVTRALVALNGIPTDAAAVRAALADSGLLPPLLDRLEGDASHDQQRAVLEISRDALRMFGGEEASALTDPWQLGLQLGGPARLQVSSDRIQMALATVDAAAKEPTDREVLAWTGVALRALLAEWDEHEHALASVNRLSAARPYLMLVPHALDGMARALSTADVGATRKHLRDARVLLSNAGAVLIPPTAAQLDELLTTTSPSETAPPRVYRSVAEFDRDAKRLEALWNFQTTYYYEVDSQHLAFEQVGLGGASNPFESLEIASRRGRKAPLWELDCPELDALARVIQARLPFERRIYCFLAELRMQGWTVRYGPHLCYSTEGDDLAALVARITSELENLPPDWVPPDPDEIARQMDTI